MNFSIKSSFSIIKKYERLEFPANIQVQAEIPFWYKTLALLYFFKIFVEVLFSIT